jgi:hypothetical protein
MVDPVSAVGSITFDPTFSALVINHPGKRTFVPTADIYLCELPVEVRGLTQEECDMTLYKLCSASWRKIYVIVIPPLDVPEIEVG